MTAPRNLQLPLMTLRVSRDSGKTWGPEQAVFGGNLPIPAVTSEWPPCRCSRCTAHRDVSKAFNTLTDHCLACHFCRTNPDQMCPEAQKLRRTWKTVWKKSLHGDTQSV